MKMRNGWDQLGFRSRMLRGLPWTILLALVAAAGRVTVPFAMQRVTDQLIERPQDGTGQLVLPVLGSALLVILAMVSASLLAYRLGRDSEETLAGARVLLLRHIHALTTSDRQRYSRGSLVSKLTNDVDQISSFLQRGGGMMLIGVAQLFLTAGLMLWYSWPLAILTLACLLPLLWLVPALQARLALGYAIVQERLGRVLGLAAEVVGGAAVVRAYGVQKRLEARFQTEVASHVTAQHRAQRLAAYAYLTGEAAVAIATVTVIVAGMLLGGSGQLTFGELTAFLFLIALFVQPLQATAEILNEFQNALASVRRLTGFLRHQPTVAAPGPDARVLPDGPLGISLEGVSYSYPGGEPVLNGIDVRIAPATSVAVVGETGSGKSTLITLLARGADPSGGEVRIGGVALPNVRTESLHNTVQLVPQDGFLFSGTIADNVRYGRPELADADVERIFAELGLSQWISALPAGVWTQVGEGGSALSAGEGQLVALARVHAAHPRVLLLDEATSHLDPLTEQRISTAVDSLSRGRTTVAIAHRLSTAVKSDEVLVIDHGTVVQRGPHAVLAAQPGRYAELYAAWLKEPQ